jgi:hypothetical protein
MRVRTLPWTTITAFYSALVNEHAWRSEPMLSLVQFLGHSPYASGLFAYTSHEILCVGRSENFLAGDGELRIRFEPSNQTFTFSYLQSPGDMSPWSRSCGAQEWQATLERILQERLGWFGGRVAV